MTAVFKKTNQLARLVAVCATTSASLLSPAWAQTIGVPLVAPLVIGTQTIGEVVCGFSSPTSGQCRVTLAATAPWCVTAGAVSVIAVDQIGTPRPLSEHPDKEKDRRRHKHIKDNPHPHDGKYSGSERMVRGYASSERQEAYKRSGGEHHDDDYGHEEHGHGGHSSGNPPASICAKVATSNFTLTPAQVCLGTADPYSLTWRGTASQQSAGYPRDDKDHKDDRDHADDKKKKNDQQDESKNDKRDYGRDDKRDDKKNLDRGDKKDDKGRGGDGSHSDDSKPTHSPRPPRGAVGWLLQGNLPCPRADT